MTYQELWHPLVPIYGEREARAVAMWLLEVSFALSRTSVMCGAVDQLSDADAERLQSMMNRLLNGEPVQYVAGVADFGPRQFRVAPGVLIPRPETYELCQWVMETAPCGALLDIGTGSGCIATTLALDMKGVQVTAWDVSAQALQIAAENSRRLGGSVCLEQQDALSPPDDEARWKVIVSNPPYICENEKADMERHVLDYEPSLALFVPDDDPLRFYHAIGSYALKALDSDGQLFFELNAMYAQETKTLLEKTGFGNVTLREDQFGRTRFLKATK